MNNYKPRIPFSDFFPKLEEMKVGTVFHTIRFIDKFDYYSELADRRAEVDIWMGTTKKTIATCDLIGIAVVTMDDLDDWIVQADTWPTWTKEKLFNLLEKFYGRKLDWKGNSSEFIIIFLLPTEVQFISDWVPTFTQKTL